MKKFLSVLLVFIFLLNSTSLSVSATFSLSNAPTSLFVYSKACPPDYTAYAKDRIDNHINSIDPSELPASGKITVGTPFSFSNTDSDIFYFPVLCNDEIIYLFRVYCTADGTFSGVFSKMLVDELNKIAKNTTPSTPLSILMEGSDIVAYVDQQRTSLYTYPATALYATSTKDLSRSISIAEDLEVISITEKNPSITFTTSVAAINSTAKAAATTNSTKSLPIGVNLGFTSHIIETQSGQYANYEWCGAFCTSWIIRYVNGTPQRPHVVDVMSFHHPYLMESDTLSPSETIEYANIWDIYPVYVEVPFAPSTLMSEIAADRPVYLRTEDPVNGGGSNSGRHGIVLRGYNSTEQTWSIWNPWYNYYDSFDWYGVYVPCESTAAHWQFTYFGTIYDWEIQ